MEAVVGIENKSGLLFPKPVLEKKKSKGLMRKTPLRAKKKYQYKPKRMKPTQSVLQSDRNVCFLCGRSNQYGLNALEEHHVFEGNGRREQSETYGLKVYLCGIDCHREGENSVQKNKKQDTRLKVYAQMVFEKTHTREEFRRIFGKSYIME